MQIGKSKMASPESLGESSLHHPGLFPQLASQRCVSGWVTEAMGNPPGYVHCTMPMAELRKYPESVSTRI